MPQSSLAVRSAPVPFEKTRAHFHTAAESAKSAGEHAAGTVIAPIAMVSIAPTIFIPYAGLFAIPALQLAAHYTVHAPLYAAQDAAKAAKHVVLGVLTGLTGK